MSHSCMNRPQVKKSVITQKHVGPTTILQLIWLFSYLCNAQEITVDEVIPSNYSVNLMPETSTPNETFSVSVSLYVNEFMGANEVTQSFQADIFLMQEWYDPRLDNNALNEDLVLTQPASIQRFWLPDLYFVNSRDTKLVKSLQLVEKLTLTKDGRFTYMLRLSASFSCHMYLLNYPHDYHTCNIQMSSLKYNKDQLQFSWDDFDVKNTAEYPMFKIRSWWTERCEKSDSLMTNSCVSGSIKLVRRLSYYIIRYYTLTFLTVVISFIGFWLPLNAWPARANITVSPLLALITTDINLNNEIGVNYTVSITIWMMFLQGFVYLEIIEYAVAIAWAHLATEKTHFAKMLEQAKANRVSTITPSAIPEKLPGYYFGNDSFFTAFGRFFDKLLKFLFGTVDYTHEPYARNKVDYASRFLFPTIFLIFVVIYCLACFIFWTANYN